MGTVLPFPKRNAGRVRRAAGMQAAGDLTLAHGTHDTGNVERLVLHRHDPLDNADLGLSLASLLYACAPKATRAKVAEHLRMLDYGGKDRRAADLRAMLGLDQ